MSPRDGLHSLPGCDLDADAEAQAEALRAGVAALLGVDRARVAVVLCASPTVDDCPATWTASADVGPSSWTSSGATPAAACAALLDFVGLCAAATSRLALTAVDRATGGDPYQAARLAAGGAP